MPQREWLDPVLIARLDNLELRARRVLDGLYSGHHVNRIRGHSQDFSDYRAYNVGDDPRSLDWKVFGRTDRLVVKQHEEQTNIAATVVLDDSASMNFSWDGRPSKLEYARTMAAALGYLIVSQNDAIGLSTRAGRLPPARERGHLEQFVERLSAVVAHDVWDIGALEVQLGSALRRRSLVLILSDLLAEPERVIAAVRRLHARKQEALVFHVFDPAERDLPMHGPVVFEDMETGETLRTDPDAMRDHYRSFVAARIALLEQSFRGAGADYLFVTTDTPFERGLGAFLSWRQART